MVVTVPGRGADFMMYIYSMRFALFLTLLLGSGPKPSRPIKDFDVRDRTGATHRLSDYSNKPIIVVAFLGTECPLAKLYAPRLNALAHRYRDRGVAFLGINSNESDLPEALDHFTKEQGLQFPLFKDLRGTAADKLGATRQLEVFVLDPSRTVRYHGRVDDQYEPGVRRIKPSREDLRIALDELLENKPVSIRETTFAGCFLQRPPRENIAGQINYARDVAPILESRCVECHRPGQIGPFSLTKYDDVTTWSETIRERISDGSMPPWHADSKHGHFANERQLTDAEKKTIFAWIDSGMERGDLRELARQRKYSVEWNLGAPDKIVTMPEPYAIPREGVLDNIAVELDPEFKEDTWIRATEVRPGNRSVVHHCTVFIGPPGLKDLVDTGRGELHYFSDFVPGLMPTVLPEGMARKIPAGWHVYLSLHYVPNGTATVDQTSFGMLLTGKPRLEVTTGNLLNKSFTLPPHAADVEVTQSWTLPADMLLLSLFPHMHLRGKSFRYEATYPDGLTEILLNVPHYDFMWQHRYVLAEPKRLPAGTVFRAIAHFDNSAANKSNPDPKATVIYGKRSTDEMFHGYFDGVMLDKQHSAPRVWPLALTLCMGCWLIVRRRNGIK